MGALPKPELTPDEQFIADAVRDGRATRQEVSMKAIGTPDVALQARVMHLNKDHCHRLDKARQLTGSLSPIVLFRQAGKGKLYLADGHHRHFVYQNAKLPAIPAWVIDSSNPELEALEFATMCNREMCLGRTTDDIKRAVKMLLENEIWWNRNDMWIAEHVGMSATAVKAIRQDFAREHNLSLPPCVSTRDGRSQAYRKSDGISNRTINVYEGKYGLAALVKGKTVRLGKNRDVADVRLSQIEEREQKKKISLSADNIWRKMIELGFCNVFDKRSFKKYPGVNAYHKNGIIVVSCDFASKAKLPMAVADATAAAEMLRQSIGSAIACEYAKELGARKIILCYPEDGPFYLMELYKAAGFEFVKPEDLKAALEQLRS